MSPSDLEPPAAAPYAYGPRALRVTLGLLVLSAVVFALFPKLDLHIADGFEDMAPSWAIGREAWAKATRQVGLWLPFVIGVAALALLVLRAAGRQAMPCVTSRHLAAVLLLLLLAPGLLVNVVLKDHWGRPRPVDALRAWEANDKTVFKPWWDPRGQCERNCSFVSGEVSGVESLVAVAAILPAAEIGVPAVLLFTAGIAFLRVAFGGHFPSDVVFAALLTHLVGIGLFALLRRPAWAALRVRPRFL